ncbi:MAG: hypothetical protein ABI878_00320 [Acidobacteriota bacterium]
MRYLLFIALFIVFGVAVMVSSCTQPKVTDNGKPANAPAANSYSNSAANSAKPADVTDRGANAPPEKTGNAVARASCMNTDLGVKRAVQKSQTFAVDFEPFKGSCFVTSYNPEYGDSHMETAFEIYKQGKKLFSFPGRFNGSTFGCWVDAVAFQDLNRDGLEDVIVVGKCAAKQSDYYENMVYMNTGKAFVTREDGNNKLEDFTSVKEITNFVQDNQQIFF